MCTLQEIISQLQKGDYLAAIDLKDAYLHIPMNKRHGKYLRFLHNKTHYQFKVLQFRIKSAPRVFTKCLAIVAAYLRKKLRLPLLGRLANKGTHKTNMSRSCSKNNSNTA